jgi:cysteinyl-tRNA synthetase
MRVINELISKANIHINEQKSDADLRTVEAIARWVTKIVGVFGLDANASAPYEGLGWKSTKAGANVDFVRGLSPYKAVYESVKTAVQGLDLSASEAITTLLSQSPDSESEALRASGNEDLEQLAYPYLRGVSRLRDELRRIAPTASPETKKSILELSDRTRDIDLTNLGVYLDDRPDNQPSLIKFIPTAELIAAREEKAAQAAEKARAKEQARLAREKAEAEKWEKAKVKPEEMYKTGEAAEKYSEWDAEGMPTKMKDGSEVPKSQVKKLKKDWDRQKKAYGEWATKFGSGSA